MRTAQRVTLSSVLAFGLLLPGAVSAASAPPEPARTDLPDLDSWQPEPVPPAPDPLAPTPLPPARPTPAPTAAPASPAPSGPAPAPASPAPAPASPAPSGPAAAPVLLVPAPPPPAYAATPSTRPGLPSLACVFRRCTDGAKDARPSLLSRSLGPGMFTINVYGDVGYAFGPQRKHRYYDYISKEVIEDYGRRDFTSYPLYVNQLSLAYAYGQIQYEIAERFRFRFALHTGHIVESLYSEERKSLQLVREATLTYYFVPKLSVEAGIFPSYYGAEIVLNKENLHATRAYIADFTPDYEAGVRLHYHVRKDMTLRFMVLNGWQEIRDQNGRKAFGFVWSINRPYKIVGDWTMYWGNEAALGEKLPVFRQYHNLYYRIWLGKRWLIFPMLDFIMQKNNTTGRYDYVVSPAFSLRLAITQRVGIAARYEYLYNKADIVPELKTGTKNGWQSHSGTLTLEYLPLPQLTFRLEGRYGTNKDAVFRNRANKLVREDYYVILSGAFHF